MGFVSARTDYSFSVVFDEKHVVTESNMELTLRWLENYLHPEWRACILEANPKLRKGKYIRVLDGDKNVWCHIIPGCTLYAEPWQILVLHCAERMATMMIAPDATLYFQRLGVDRCTTIKIQVNTDDLERARATREGIWRSMGAMKERQAGICPEPEPILDSQHGGDTTPYILLNGCRVETGDAVLLDASAENRVVIVAASQEPLFEPTELSKAVSND